MTMYPYQDPHDDSFAACNLNQEEWRLYQRDSDTLSLAKTIKDVFSQGLVAKISRRVLNEIGMSVSMRSGVPYNVFQERDRSHWCGMALCMLTHGYMDWSDSESIRFYKSPYDQEPMYWGNIEVTYSEIYFKDTWTRIVKKPVKEVKPEPAQRSLF